MLHAQVRSAVRFLTNRTHGGGILSLDASTGKPGHSVLDTLREKHPAPGTVVESAFLLCDVLLPLIWISQQTMWSTWLTKFRDLLDLVDLQLCSGMDIYFGMVLQVHIYGMQLLRWPVIWPMDLLIGRLYVPCPDLMASRLIALDKCPGVTLLVLVILLVKFYVRLLLWPLVPIWRRPVG